MDEKITQDYEAPVVEDLETTEGPATVAAGTQQTPPPPPA
jgi:hypothetical protein